MLFLVDSLTTSLWKYFFLVRIHCSVYITNSLLAANCMFSWASYLLHCKPRLIKLFHLFHAAYILYFFTLSKSIDDAQSFLGYVLSTKFVFRIRFSSASRAHSSLEGLWWTEDSCSGVRIINTGNARVRERRECISRLSSLFSSAVYNQGQLTLIFTRFRAAYNQRRHTIELIRQAHNGRYW